MENENIELRKYLAVLARWWWIMVLSPVICASVAYVYGSLQTPQYRATEQILVQGARSGLLGPAIPGTNEQLAGTYAELATTNRLLTLTGEELGLPSKPRASASGRGSVLTVSAEHPDPVIAKDIASKLSEILIRDIQTSKLLEIARLESLAQSQGIEVDREVLQAQMSTIDSLRVIEPAETPGSPFAPNPVRNAVLGAALGLMVAVLIAFLIELFSKRIRSLEELDQLFDGEAAETPVLGMICRWNRKDVAEGSLVTKDNPFSFHAEMFRQLRAGLQFARDGEGSDARKALLITSATPEDGKTTISSNLAIVLAQAGVKVILVDGDLRRPSLHEVFGVPQLPESEEIGGLYRLLVEGSRSVADELTDVEIPGLKLVTSGNVLMNPADLLSLPGTGRVFHDLREMCDVMIVDSPPVLAAVDPLIIAGFVDGVVLTVNMANSRLDSLRDAHQQLQRTGTPILGYVVNKVANGTSSGAYGRYYRQYGYNQGVPENHKRESMKGFISRTTGRGNDTKSRTRMNGADSSPAIKEAPSTEGGREGGQ